ncbi:MAG TPA: hypothetical protein VN706_22640 [Gemmatimonadaceae bacterium]|nr:hypothetical protein [Gemmatimonadaceae bacterium]
MRAATVLAGLVILPLSFLAGQRDSLGRPVPLVRRTAGAMRVAAFDVAGSPLTGAEIELPTLEVKFLVPQGGRLLINDVPAGVYVVQLRRLGYQMQTRLVAVRRDTIDVHFALERVVTELDTVNVRAAQNLELRDFERRLKAYNGYFYTAKDIAASHAGRLTDFLATLPRVHLRPVGGAYSAQAPLGAAGGCPSGVEVYLDGVAVNALEGGDPARSVKAISSVKPPARPQPTGPAGQGSSPASTGGRGRGAAAVAQAAANAPPDPLAQASGQLPPFDINAISVTQIAALEVYPDGAPALMYAGAGGKCGLVLLWSKVK